MAESVSIDVEKWWETYFDVLNSFSKPKCLYLQYSRRCRQNSNFKTPELKHVHNNTKDIEHLIQKFLRGSYSKQETSNRVVLDPL